MVVLTGTDNDGGQAEAERVPIHQLYNTRVGPRWTIHNRGRK